MHDHNRNPRDEAHSQRARNHEPHGREHLDRHHHDHEGEHEHYQEEPQTTATYVHADPHKHHDHAHHDHAHHDHDHGHHHDHEHKEGLWGWISTIFHLHGHSHQQTELATDQAFLDNNLGIRTVWIALALLTVTSLLQIFVVYLSGSVALLGDTVHNIGDGLNSIPLLIAFYLARHAANRRYNFGFARAEDVAGIFIVISIAFSAGYILWESISRFIHPQPLSNLGWLTAAAIIGFVGNELVALIQIRIGRRIGSAALVADGLHARTDGLTSLAVLLAAGGTAIGFPILDPIIGMMIGVTIVFITWDATKQMWFRLMDAIEPEYLAQAEATVQKHGLVRELHRVRMRWVGHQLYAEIFVAVDPDLTTLESHTIAEEIRHDLFHAIPKLYDIVVHVDPYTDEVHQITLHHDPPPQPLRV